MEYIQAIWEHLAGQSSERCSYTIFEPQFLKKNPINIDLTGSGKGKHLPSAAAAVIRGVPGERVKEKVI